MSTVARSAHRNRSRVLDYLLNIVIAFAFIGITFFVQNKWCHDASIRGFGLVGFTLGLYPPQGLVSNTTSVLSTIRPRLLPKENRL
jgi:hypothetical protein